MLVISPWRKPGCAAGTFWVNLNSQVPLSRWWTRRKRRRVPGRYRSVIRRLAVTDRGGGGPVSRNRLSRSTLAYLPARMESSGRMPVCSVTAAAPHSAFQLLPVDVPQAFPDPIGHAWREHSLMQTPHVDRATLPSSRGARLAALATLPSYRPGTGGTGSSGMFQDG
jgi:hypothetical protein